MDKQIHAIILKVFTFKNKMLVGDSDENSHRTKERALKIIKRIFQFIVILILIFALLAGYAFYIEPDRMVVRQFSLEGRDKNLTHKLRIVQLSDIQVSRNYTPEKLDDLVTKVNKLSPDFIVFTGDLFDNFANYGAGQQQEVGSLLGKLKSTYGKYAIWGNRDYGGGAQRHYENVMGAGGFTILTNESTVINVENEKKIFIGGVDDALLGTPDVDVITKAMEETYDYRLILLHEPDLSDKLSDSMADLILAGHSHGGQVLLPFNLSMKTAMAEKYVKGFYTINEESNMQLYVNTGIGTSHLPVRFLVPPQIAVFDVDI